MASLKATVDGGTWTTISPTLGGINSLAVVGSTLCAWVMYGKSGTPFWYSNNDGTTWSSSNVPTGSGDDLGSLVVNATNDGVFLPFHRNPDMYAFVSTSMSPPAWSSETIWAPTGTSGQGFRAAARSNGEIVAFARGATTARIMGTDYQQVAYKRRTGPASFTSEVTISQGDQVNYDPRAIFVHGDRVHFRWVSSGGSTLYGRTLSPSDTLGTTSTRSSAFQSGGTLVLSHAVVTGTSTMNYLCGDASFRIAHITFDGASDNPTDTFVDAVETTSGFGGGGTAILAAAPDGSGDLYAFYGGMILPDDTDSRKKLFMKVKPNGGSWGPRTLVYTSTKDQPRPIGTVSYVNSSGVPTIGILVNDYQQFSPGTDNLLYFTHELAGPPGTPTAAPTVAAGVDKVTVTTPALSTSTDAASFRIYRGSTMVASGLAGGVAYDDTGASASMAQTYTVRGFNDSGESASGPASAAVAANPGPPSSVAFARGDGTITVKVTKKPYDAAYRIFRGPLGGTRTLVHTSTNLAGGGGTYDWIDSGVSNSSPYDYSVIVDVSTPTARSSAESTAYTASPNYWEPGKPSFTPVRMKPWTFTIGQYIYMAGGQTTGSSSSVTTAFLRYDTVNDTWTTMTPFAASTAEGANFRQGFTCAGKGYVQYQNSGPADLREYDPVGNTWTTITGPPTTQFWYTTVVGTKIYCIGGGGSGDMYVMDPTVSYTWEALAAPGAGADTPLFPYGGYLYAITRSTWRRYDPVNNTWAVASGDPLPPVAGMTALSYFNGTNGQTDPAKSQYGNKVYYFNSSNSYNNPRTDVWMIDLATRTWSKIDDNIPNTMVNMGMARVENNLYLFGGGYIDASSNWQVYGYTRKYVLPLDTSNKTGTAAFSGSGTLAATGVAGRLGTAAASGSGTLAATGVVIATAAASGAGTLGAVGSAGFASAATLSGGSALGVVGIPRWTGQLALSGGSTLTTTAIATVADAATLSGGSALTASGPIPRVTAATAALSSTGSLSPDAGIIGDAAFASEGAASATGSAAITGATSAPTGSGALAATGKVIASAALAGGGVTTVTATPSIPGSSAAKGGGTLTVSGHASFAGGTVVSGAGSLAASGSSSGTTIATLTGSGDLAAVGVASVTGTAAFAGSSAVAGEPLPKLASQAYLTAEGTLTSVGVTNATSVGLTGAGALSATGEPTLAVQVALSGSGRLAEPLPLASRRDMTVLVGVTRVGSVEIGTGRVGTVEVAESRHGTVDAGPTRQGVEVGETRTNRGA